MGYSKDELTPGHPDRVKLQQELLGHMTKRRQEYEEALTEVNAMIEQLQDTMAEEARS